MPSYFDRTGLAITKQEWQSKRNDEDYVVVCHYLCEAFRVRVLWVGGPFEGKLAADARPFELRVGTMIKDPITGKIVEHDNLEGVYRDEQEAINAYEYFLVTHHNTGCEWLGGDPPTFLERGNLLVLSADAPKLDGMTDVMPEEFGTW